ncbi:hypothetical protein [Butyricimonas sp.]|uniref:hypothetical protein n=1 Tax=Butyricimonas sp. TaxID=1969738 RepID=UPI0025C20B21|nr:hypothetical protein [Butyricimonas sp.]
MKNILAFMIVIISLVETSCHEVEIGYLVTEYASYSLDSLVVYKDLDTTEPVEQANPEYQQYLNWGYTPEQIMMYFPGVYPTVWIGGKDYFRVYNNQPWTGTSIEGVQGTQPIFARIKSIKSSDGDINKLQDCIQVYGNGVIEIPVINNVPKGRYLVSLTFWNEGWSKDVDDCFTIIVK